MSTLHSSTIHELSFTTVEALPPVPAVRTTLNLGGGMTKDPIEQLRRLVHQLKTNLGLWIAVAPGLDRATEPAIVYPDHLTRAKLAAAIGTVTARNPEPLVVYLQDSTAIDLRHHRLLLLQYCNYELCRLFRGSPAFQVRDRHQRIYSTQKISRIGREVEVQRYLKFDFKLDSADAPDRQDGQDDRHDYLVLCLDYANEYRSLLTLDRLDLQHLHRGQRLIQAYDGKGCEWVGWAAVSVGEPLAELGGYSLLDYHHQRGHLSNNERRAIDPQAQAALVRYPNQQQTIHHLPHQLKRLYDRADLPSGVFDRHIHPLHQKVKLATDSIHWLNRQGFCLGDRLTFNTTLRQPAPLVEFNTGPHKNNLDFGTVRCGEVWHGWQKRRLLDRPRRIRTQVIYPSTWQIEMQNYMQGLRGVFAKFDIVLDRAGDHRPYNPLDRASLHATYRDLPNSDLVFAFVPTRDEPGFDIEINPYNTLKRELFEQNLPSQMVTYTTARKAARQNVLEDKFAQNVVLSILAKLGHHPWQIHDLPGTADAFVGLDIGRQGDRGTVAAGCIVGDRGKLVGWTSRCLAGGETIGDEDLQSMLSDLVIAFHQSRSPNAPPLRHLVIHRDGTFKNRELDTIRTFETKLRADGLRHLDLVEIVKDHVVRAAKWDGRQFLNPARGAGWRHTADEAIVLTTGAPQAKVSPNASPQPLLVRRRSGNTDLMTLAAQVYWLSEMHVGSSMVVRLPITTYFPDRIAEVTLKGLLPKTVHHESRPWFI